MICTLHVNNVIINHMTFAISYMFGIAFSTLKNMKTKYSRSKLTVDT